MSPRLTQGSQAWTARAAARRLFLALAVLAAMPGSSGAVQAQGADPEASPASKQATSMSLTFEPAPMEGLPHYLTARLVAEDGSAVVGERVSMRRDVDVFGGRTVTLGRATTDNAGVARVPVEPREDIYRVTASFAGSDTLAPSQTVDELVFPADLVILPEHVPQSGLVDPQLRPLADTMPLVIGGAVIVIWAILLLLTFMTLSRVRSAGRKERVAPASGSAEVPGAGSGSQRWNP